GVGAVLLCGVRKRSIEVGRDGISGPVIQVCRVLIYSIGFRRGMRSGIVVVGSVARRSGSSVIAGAVTISSMQLYSQDHSSWDRKQLVIICAIGSAPIPRWSLFVHIKYEREGTKSKTDLFYRNDDISSWMEA